MGDKWTPDEALKRAARKNAEAMKDSAVFLVMFSEGMVEEVIPLIQMGLAVYLDKPLLILAPESQVLKIPENLKRMAQGLEIYPDGDIEGMKRAMNQLIEAGTLAGRKVES